MQDYFSNIIKFISKIGLCCIKTECCMAKNGLKKFDHPIDCLHKFCPTLDRVTDAIDKETFFVCGHSK